MLKIFEQQTEKIAKKLIDRSLYGGRKDRRIKELWLMLNEANAVIKTYGHFADNEANPDWMPPPWLRDGEYTMEKRLKDIRYHGRKLEELEKKIDEVLFKDCDITPI